MCLVLSAISGAVKSTSKAPFLQHSHDGMSPLLLPEHAANLSFNPCSALPPHHPCTSYFQSAAATRPLHPSLAGTGRVWLLLLPDVSFLLPSPWIMEMSYEQRARGILKATEKCSPPPALRIFQFILRHKSFLLAISSEKLVYPPFPLYIINETALMNTS